jgi:hypothetical protein
MSNIPVNNKVLSEIVEKTNASTGMFVQGVFKDTLRNLINIFNNIYFLDRNNSPVKIKCFHANQERAIAKITTGDNITLPVISIGESVGKPDDRRSKYSPILVHDKYFDKKSNRAIRILSMAPRPLNITYEVNIWSKYKQDLDQIREHIFFMFNPDLEVKTKYSQITKAFIESESDSGSEEVDDAQDRILRRTITVNVETYIPSPKFLYTSTGKIEEFNFELEIVEDLNLED